MQIQMKLADKNTIVNILADLATNAQTGPFKFFKNLIQQTDLPVQMKQQLANIGQDSPDIDARSLLEYALIRNINPKDTAYTTIGSILRPLLESDAYGWETRRTLAVIVVVYHLYRDEAALIDLMTRFKIPRPPQGPDGATGGAVPPLPMNDGGGAVVVGPDIEWREGDPDLTLQSWPWSEPEYLDVGFLMRATDRAAAVCRVELPSQQRTGTGFLIAPDLLLTNYHVLRFTQEEDMKANAADVMLRFGFITDAAGGNAAGQTFKLASDSIVDQSPIHELDFVLLRVDGSVKNTEGIKPLSAVVAVPGQDKSLNIIQHPEGQTLKIALSSNGVSGVYQDTGLIQYMSRAAGGSSGSPCFDDAWKLVALHHAERSRAFGSIREGILYSHIRGHIKNEQIKNLLPG